MEKVILLIMFLFLLNNAYAGEVVCKSRDYSCFIDNAQKKISDGRREEGVSILSSITGASVDARTALALDLMSRGGIKGAAAPKARLLLESAFREGDMDAGRFLLNFYVGEKVDINIFPRNNERAIFILKKVLPQQASSSGILESLLGKLLLEQGQKKESIFWLKQSVERGNILATEKLVLSLSYGDEKDIIEAWFYSDIGGSSMASEKNKLEKQMTPEQLEQAQQMSWDWQDAHHIRMPGYRSQGSPIQWQVN